MSLDIHVWQLTGLTPLLQNNPAISMQTSEEEGITAAKKKVYDDEEEAKIRTYVADDGKFYHPSAGIRSCMLEAAKGRKIGKKAARTILAGAVFPTEDKLWILDGKGKPAKKYKIHKTRVKIGKAGVLRARPEWDPWSMKVPIEIDTDFVPEPNWITEILNVAGRIVGLGDFRPDTSQQKTGVGSYGRFSAEFIK